jgi:hypothetical protein
MKYKLKLRGETKHFTSAFIYSPPNLTLQVGSIFLYEGKHWEIKAIIHMAIEATESNESPLFTDDMLTTLTVESFPVI